MKPSDKIRADERQQIQSGLSAQPKMKMAAEWVAKINMTMELKKEMGWKA